MVYNCQYVQSAYVNDLASRYVKQFAVFGNSLNFNPGAGDAFFETANSDKIDTAIFNGGERPYLDAVQSGLGNAPIVSADRSRLERRLPDQITLTPSDHSKIYIDENKNYKDISNPYVTEASPNT